MPTVMAASASARIRQGVIVLALVLSAVGLWIALTVGRFSAGGPSVAPHAPPGARPGLIELDRFSTFIERGPDAERLHVSLRLRNRGASQLPCFVFVVARSEAAGTRASAIWPSQPAGSVITPGGHFVGGDPEGGYRMVLTERWERVHAILPQPADGPPYSMVFLYVLDPNGVTLLARPFRL